MHPESPGPRVPHLPGSSWRPGNSPRFLIPEKCHGNHRTTNPSSHDQTPRRDTYVQTTWQLRKTSRHSATTLLFAGSAASSLPASYTPRGGIQNKVHRATRARSWSPASVANPRKMPWPCSTANWGTPHPVASIAWPYPTSSASARHHGHQHHRGASSPHSPVASFHKSPAPTRTHPSPAARDQSPSHSRVENRSAAGCHPAPPTRTVCVGTP